MDMAEHYGARFFGEREAAAYDELEAAMFDPAVVNATVDLLADLAGGGDVLEMGIGTGRIALPLVARGLRVHRHRCLVGDGRKVARKTRQ